MSNRFISPLTELRRVTESLSSNERALFRQELIQQLPDFLERLADQVKESTRAQKTNKRDKLDPGRGSN